MGDIKLPKKEKKLPLALTKEEVEKLLASIKNFKHRLLIELMLSSGLRVSEAVKLETKHLDFDSAFLNVISGKGKKDRLAIVSESLLSRINTHLNTRKEQSPYLFPSRLNPDKHISIKLAQKIVKQASIRAGIKKNVYCHLLRSTFATMLLNQGVDIRKIQVLLGHSSIATTERYTYVSKEEIKKIKNPLDSLFLP
ncbi:tyrosine-type recombinase/integrase [archaeon]|nr:tyrosine-type recombinase/integrase [archaeon]